MKEDGDKSLGLSPITIGVALGASAAVWLVVEMLRRFLS
jgi:hypothetical protein